MQSTRKERFSAATRRVRAERHHLGVAHGHDAAISDDKLLHGEACTRVPRHRENALSQKLGIHEWSYDKRSRPTSATSAVEGQEDHAEDIKARSSSVVGDGLRRRSAA